MASQRVGIDWVTLTFSSLMTSPSLWLIQNEPAHLWLQCLLCLLDPLYYWLLLILNLQKSLVNPSPSPSIRPTPEAVAINLTRLFTSSFFLHTLSVLLRAEAKCKSAFLVPDLKHHQFLHSNSALSDSKTYPLSYVIFPLWSCWLWFEKLKKVRFLGIK